MQGRQNAHFYTALMRLISGLLLVQYWIAFDGDYRHTSSLEYIWGTSTFYTTSYIIGITNSNSDIDIHIR